MRTLRLSFVAALAIVAACTSAPIGDGFIDRVGRSFQRVVDRSASLLPEVGRDTRQLADGLVTLPDAAGREFSKLAGSTAGLAAAGLDELASLGPETVGQLTAAQAASNARLGRLSGVPAATIDGLADDSRALHRALGDLPRTLRLDRTPFAGPGDPEVETALEPESPRRTWLARMIDRIGI